MLAGEILGRTKTGQMQGVENQCLVLNYCQQLPVNACV